MYSAEEKIKWFAIISRIFVFVWQSLANCLVTDHISDAFIKPLYNISLSAEDDIFKPLTEGLTRWDAQYFLHIAEYGYTYENTLAFFPLFPLFIRFLGFPFHLILNHVFSLSNLPFVLSFHNTIILMAIVLNNVLFIHSSLLLFKLTLKITNNEKLAYVSAILFCVNPASIFFSAAYSETLYCFLTLSGLYYLESGHILWTSLLFGLSGLTRSNGIINIFYIFHRVLKTRRNALSIIFSFIVLTFSLILSLLPFVMYQFYCYTKFCVVKNQQLPEFIVVHADFHDYVLPGEGSPWCKEFIPFAYSYVQKHYWEVGFLQYYDKKQLPNFILAFPVLSLTLFGTYKFVKNHGFSLIFLGFVSTNETYALPARCFPYVLHSIALAIFSALCMHVQVSTRLIFSSCPAIYWFCATVLVDKMSESKEAAVARKLSKSPNAFFEPVANKKSKWKTIILSERFLGLSLIIRYYFFAFFMAGPAIFANNLPWT